MEYIKSANMNWVQGSKVKSHQWTLVCNLMLMFEVKHWLIVVHCTWTSRYLSNSQYLQFQQQIWCLPMENSTFYFHKWTTLKWFCYLRTYISNVTIPISCFLGLKIYKYKDGGKVLNIYLLRCGDTYIYIYIYQTFRSPLVQVMACHLCNAKPWPEPMMTYLLIVT